MFATDRQLPIRFGAGSVDAVAGELGGQLRRAGRPLAVGMDELGTEAEARGCPAVLPTARAGATWITTST